MADMADEEFTPEKLELLDEMIANLKFINRLLSNTFSAGEKNSRVEPVLIDLPPIQPIPSEIESTMVVDLKEDQIEDAVDDSLDLVNTKGAVQVTNSFNNGGLGANISHQVLKPFVKCTSSNFVPEVFIPNSLLDLYTKCGSLVDAQKVFDEMGNKDLCLHWVIMTGLDSIEPLLAHTNEHQLMMLTPVAPRLPPKPPDVSYGTTGESNFFSVSGTTVFDSYVGNKFHVGDGAGRINGAGPDVFSLSGGKTFNVENILDGEEESIIKKKTKKGVLMPSLLGGRGSLFRTSIDNTSSSSNHGKSGKYKMLKSEAYAAGDIGSRIGIGGLSFVNEMAQVVKVAQFGVIFVFFALDLEISTTKLRVVRAVDILGAMVLNFLMERNSSNALHGEVTLDNLFCPRGPILEAQEAAKLFGASQTWFLVGGTTCGIQAAVMATCSPGEFLILPRNCHILVIFAMVLSGLVPKHIIPDYKNDWDIAGSISPLQVLNAMQELERDGKKAAAVLITSPTYHGICSSLKEISDLCHSRKIPLIVDEAHGAHLGFHSELPKSALQQGADLIVQSTHKVLCSLTQSSMLHMSGNIVDKEKNSRCLQTLQTTSPSYLLLTSLDAARAQLSESPDNVFIQAIKLACEAKCMLKSISGISVLENSSIPTFPAIDPLRLTVGFWQLGLSGYEAVDILYRDYGIVCELVGNRSITYVLNLGTCREHVQRLLLGIKHLSATYAYIQLSYIMTFSFEIFTSLHQYFNGHDLEDKVNFNGGGNVMSQMVTWRKWCNQVPHGLRVQKRD